MTDTPPPHSNELEQQVLGAMAFGKKPSSIGVSLLVEADFYSSRHRVIFAALVALSGLDLAPDLTLLSIEINKSGRLEEVGDTAYLADVIASVGTTTQIEHHAELLIEMSFRRKTIASAQKLATNAADASMPVEELVDGFVHNLVTERGNKAEPSVQVSELAQRNIDLYRKGQAPVSIFPTGFPDNPPSGIPSELDRHMRGGFTSKRLFILFAQTSAGKTPLVARLAVMMARRGIGMNRPARVSVLILEDSAGAFVERIQAQTALLDPAWTQRGPDDNAEETLKKLDGAYGDVKGLPVQVGELGVRTVDRVLNWMRREKYMHQSNVFFIDHFRAIAQPMGKDSEQTKVSSMLQAFQAFAMQEDVCVTIVHHPNRDADRDKRIHNRIRRPTNSDIGLSSGFETYAFGIIYLLNPYASDKTLGKVTLQDAHGNDWPEDRAVLGCLKMKNGVFFEIPLKWVGKHGLFLPADGPSVTPASVGESVAKDDDQDNDDLPF